MAEIKVEQSKKAIEILRNLGIVCLPNFIIYDMWSTVDEMESNYNFIKETKIYKTENSVGIFGNGLAIIANTYLESVLKDQSILKPWEFYKISSEDQDILNSLEAIQYYEVINPQMKKFLEYHNYWTKKLNDKCEQIDIAINNDVVDEVNLQKFIKWKSMVSVFSLKLFKKVIDDVRSENSNLKDELDLLMIDYDKKMFGYEFDASCV